MTDSVGPGSHGGWRALLPVTLLVAVAGVQVMLATTAGLSAWKGGGFGMFSTTDDGGRRYVRIFVTAPERFAAQAWDASDHVLRQYLGRLGGVDGEAGDRLGHDVFVEVLAEVPDAWLEAVPGAGSPEQLRAAYVAFLDARLATRAWLPLERAS